MLTDSEILDNKTQSLDEALELLNKENLDDGNSPGPIPNEVLDVKIGEQLEVATECVNVLADLRNTISVEGVSVYDVAVLRNIRAKMESLSLVPTKSVALERYEGTFTQDRSMLNLKVSTEAVKFEFVKTIKEWIFKLIDFVIKVINWARFIMNSELIVSKRITAIKDNVKGARDIVTSLRKLNSLSNRDMEAKYAKVQETILLDPKLPRNMITLAGFSAPKASKEISETVMKLIKSAGDFETLVTRLKVLVEGGDLNTTRGAYGVFFGDSVKVLDTFTEESPDTNYFINNPDMQGFSFENVIALTTRSMVYADRIMYTLDKTGQILRTLKRFEGMNDLDDQGIEAIRETVTNVSAGVTGLEKFLQFNQAMTQSYFKTSACYVNYFSMVRSVILEDFAKHAITDVARVTLEKLNKKWDELMYSFGL